MLHIYIASSQIFHCIHNNNVSLSRLKNCDMRVVKVNKYLIIIMMCDAFLHVSSFLYIGETNFCLCSYKAIILHTKKQ